MTATPGDPTEPAAATAVTARTIADTATGTLRIMALRYAAALGPAADAPPHLLAHLAENDSRPCDADCGERIYGWQPSWPVSFDPDLRACSVRCRERMEDEHAETVRETCEELAAEAVRESAGRWPS